MDKFLLHDDETGRLIQRGAADLYHRLEKIDADNIGMPDHCLYYYKASHSKRLFFSIETSAHLLYKSIKTSDKNVTDITIMDYGAGVGTLYLLAKMIGCRKVVYNDHLEDWKHSAQLIADAIGIKIDQYIVGDIAECLDQLDATGTKCDIITSRNVIEHIYRLEKFYDSVYIRQPHAIIFSSTTANNYNPAAVIKHKMWHRKWEKVYRGKRLGIIRRIAPGLDLQRAQKLATATQGLAANELNDAIIFFTEKNILPDPSRFRSNTCDPENGVWAEHLLSAEEYRAAINTDHYEINFEAGFWDTHYSRTYMNKTGKLLNALIRKGTFAMQLAPFIYVIAKPKYTTRER